MAQIGSLVWLIAGASLLGIVTRVAIPPMTWCALVFLVHASRSMPVASGAAALWLALYAALAFGFRASIPVPGPGYFAIIAFLATGVLFPFLVDRLVATRFGVLGSTLVFPIAWVAVEFLRSRFTPAATWGSIAYTQYGYLPLMQVAALVGIWGITFVIAWFASTFELAWSRGFAWNIVHTPVLTFAAVLGAIVIGGAVRVAAAPTDRPSLRAATLNRPVDLFVPGQITRITEGRVAPDERPRVNEQLARLHDWFLEGSRREARAGARLIVWPEGNLLVLAGDEPAFLDRARQVASDERIYLAMGMGTIHLGEKLPFENKLVLIDPAGQIKMDYLKSHPVTGWEAGIMRVGDGHVPIVATEAGRIAGAICFDADFPDFIRQAGRGAADLLILPVNEWKGIEDIHFQMQAFRAIENGLPLVRAAASGISTAIDPWGRVLGVSNFFASGDRTLTVQVPVGHLATLYSKIGDLFAWTCVACLVMVLAMAAIAQVSSRRDHDRVGHAAAIAPV